MKKNKSSPILIVLLLLMLPDLAPGAPADTVYLEQLAVEKGQSGWKAPQVNTNIEGGPLILDEKTYKRGVGVHAHSLIAVNLRGKVQRFKATIGVDARMKGIAAANPVKFLVWADGKKMLETPPMRAEDKPVPIDIALGDKFNLLLEVRTAGNRTTGTFANWCNARLTTLQDARPRVFKPGGGRTTLKPGELTEANDTSRNIISRKSTLAPSINTPLVYGTRPGKQFFIYVAIAGKKPFDVQVNKLPAGVRYNPDKRIIEGRIAEEGEYECFIEASNAHGTDQKTLRLQAGDAIQLTPPMGWNSWNAFGPDINQERIRETAAIIKSSGLAEHGWSVITIDDGWQGPRDTATQRITASEKFPAIKTLVDDIHEMGLKAGIYSTPWVTSYMNLPGGSADTKNGQTFYPRQDFGVYSFHQEDATQFSDWGFDYLKYDWAENHYPYAHAMHKALARQDRNITLSLSGAVHVKEAGSVARVCELYRVNGDIKDTWESIYRRGFYHTRWQPFHGPGQWADPDMLVVGHVGWGKEPHPSKLTPWEQVTHMSLWSLYSAPMILGADLRKLDAFTKALLTNDEVIAVNQDPHGAIAEHRTADYKNGRHVFVKPLSDGSKAIGLFNTAGKKQTMQVSLKSSGIERVNKIRDLWQRQNLKPRQNLEFVIPPHGCKLLRVY